MTYQLILDLNKCTVFQRVKLKTAREAVVKQIVAEANENQRGISVLSGDTDVSRHMRFPTMWYVRPAKTQTRLRIRAVQSEHLVVVWILIEQHFEFRSLKGSCTGSSESTLAQITHCWKSHFVTRVFVLILYHFLVRKLNFSIIMESPIKDKKTKIDARKKVRKTGRLFLTQYLPMPSQAVACCYGIGNGKKAPRH